MRLLWPLRRWWVKRFRTKLRPAPVNLDAGRVLTTDEWRAQGGFRFAAGWHVERPDWWQRGSSSGVTALTAEKACARLDEWQDDMAQRAA